MELEVRRVPGVCDCFVALPLGLIEALQGGFDSVLSLVVLELRLHYNSATWYLAWAGAASRSSSIEVSEKLAECIGLPAGARVHIRALADVAKAKTVVLEPATEDDWEILELNADFVEDHILSQVDVLCTGQLFPVWVQGQNALTLHVISTSPKRVVQLVPGAELIVAPKQRRKQTEITAGKTDSAVDESFSTSVKAWLRVQELDPSLAQTCDLKDFQYHILPTTAIFVSPETAKAIPFVDGQLVVLTSVDAKRTKKKEELVGESRSEQKHNLRAKVGVAGKGDRNSRLVVLRLVYCNLVAVGHVMIASSLRLFLGARIHTRVLVKASSQPPNVMQPLLFISPVDFETAEKLPDDLGNGNNGQKDETLEGVQNFKVASERIYEEDVWEWEKHKELLTLTTNFTDVPRGTAPGTIAEGKESSNFVGTHKAERLFKLWVAAQIAAISNNSPGQCSSVPITKEVIMQFIRHADFRKQREYSDKISDENIGEIFTYRNINGWKRKQARDLCFMLTLHSSKGEYENTDVQAETLESKQLPSYKGFFLFEKDLLENAEFQIKKEQVNGMAAESLRIKLGQPYHILCLSENAVEANRGPNLASLTWLEGPAAEVLSRLQVLLSPKARDKFNKIGLASPGYVLLHGPPACGKTKLASALARELEEDPCILAHKILVRCAELGGEQAQTVRVALQNAVSEAVQHAPSLIILDDLDIAIPSTANSENSEPSTTAVVLAEFLADLLDTFQVCGKNRFGASIAFLAVARAVSNLPACLCSSGRFDFHVALPAPATTERAAILSQELEQRSLTCQRQIITETAAKCDGYDAADLEVVVDRAVHVAAARFLSLSIPNVSCMADNQHMSNGKEETEILTEQGRGVEQTISFMENHKFELLKEDFSEALDGFLPVSMRDVAKAGGQGGRLGWEDVGGLNETCRALKEMLELPVKYSKIFAEAPLRLRSGVLLYGPPGCGKTHIVGAAAAACSLRFISVKGPELLNKYIGASEQGVRDIFAKATAAAPCILFFDEFDAIAPKRGHDNTGVTDRVVNQLLTELDGVEALNGVFVFAATSRPDLLDAALLRPGRLDRLLLCDFPTARERLEILQVLSRKLPLAEDVNLNVVATLTEDFSGADLQALLSDAQLEAVHKFLLQSKSNEGNASSKAESPIITMGVLREALAKARPSVSEEEKRRLYNIYKMFMSSRSSVAGKARDAKGKRATLA